MSRHVSINACHKGADVVLTQGDGRVFIVQWTWDQWEAFVREHGEDVTHQAKAMLTVVGDLPKGPIQWSHAGTFLEHAFVPRSGSLNGCTSLCGRALYATTHVLPRVPNAVRCTSCENLVATRTPDVGTAAGS